jgi:hypothetical protein
MVRLILVTAMLALGCKSSTVGKPKDIGNACTSGGNCSSGICLPIQTHNVCTATCNNADDCPAGWVCMATAGKTSICDCVPSLEICDGIDNDCNGIIDDGCAPTPDLASTDLAVPPVPMTTKVDVLFVVDNSPSMNPIQAELKSAFPTFATALNAFPSKGAATSFHVGVVTTDLGSGPTSVGSNCKVGGLGGRLQPLGAAHDISCLPPTGGENFMDIDQIGGGNNLPAGQSFEQTFTCMASVGDTGCGFEHVLESPYKALSGGIPENAGFLRDDALLAVIWLTNEDDCSADPNTDLFAQANTQYGGLFSYRCTNYGIMCGNPPMLMPYGDSGGPLSMCQGATAAVGGKLFEVSRYINYFTQAGGVKANPGSVILASLAAPTAPVSSFLGSPTTYAPCAGPPSGTTCAVLLNHSCIQPQNPAINGDPAVRLAQVVESAPRHFEASVCDASFATSLQAIADAILQARLGQ